MANILIIGDSWGVIPYDDFGRLLAHFDLHPAVADKIKGSDINRTSVDWLPYQLMRRGHNVFNFSMGGQRNEYMLSQGAIFLEATKASHKIDLVIWFHTELCRGFEIRHMRRNAPDGKFDTWLDWLGDLIYGFATDIHNRHPGPKWAIIGGHAPLRGTKKYLLDWADYRIDDWRSELLEQPMPECHTLSFLTGERSKDFYDTAVGMLGKDILEREVSSAELISKLGDERRDLFYDGVHPSVQSNIKLAQRIIDHFNL